MKISKSLTTFTFSNKCTRLLTLENSCTGGARTQLAIARAGGIDLALGALRLGLQSPDISGAGWGVGEGEYVEAEGCKRDLLQFVAAEGCLALWNIAALNATTQRDVVERGGVSLLLRAILLDGGNAVLQRSASGALWNLMCGPQSEGRYVEVKQQVVEGGGIAALLEVIRNHMRDEQVFLLTIPV